jgi:hypothetical protein
MSYSHAENAELPCRNCGQPFAADVWVIVDPAERPDLLVRLLAGTLHDLTCPACGHTATLDAPLLIVRPAAEPVLLFSPARGGGPQQAEAQAAALVSLLRAHVGAAWRDEWLGRGVVGVARAALPALLGDDPATAAALAAAATADEDALPPALAQALAEIVAALAAEGVRVDTAEELTRALDARPELKARLQRRLSNM